MQAVRYFLIFIGLSVVFLGSTSVEAGKRRREKKPKTGMKTVRIKPDKPDKSNGKCVPVSDKESAIKLRCGSKNKNIVIYSIDINSYNSTECNDDTTQACSGLQPSVLTDSNQCYSQKSCVITFRRNVPIVKTANSTCIGKIPSRLKASYRCVHADTLFHLHKSGGNKTISNERKSDFGMLVSHDAYPWHYENGLVIRLNITPKTSEKTKLYISVPVFELDYLDKVLVANYSGDTQYKDINIIKTEEGKADLIRPSPDKKSQVKFFTNKNSSTAKGFIICYYWTVHTEDLSEVDICSKLKIKRKKTRKPKPEEKGKTQNGKSKKRKGSGKKNKKKKGRKGRKQKRNLRNK